MKKSYRVKQNYIYSYVYIYISLYIYIYIYIYTCLCVYILETILKFNTLRTGDADLRFYIRTVQDG